MKNGLFSIWQRQKLSPQTGITELRVQISGINCLQRQGFLQTLLPLNPNFGSAPHAIAFHRAVSTARRRGSSSAVVLPRMPQRFLLARRRRCPPRRSTVCCGGATPMR
jgi:hypothetical protein